MRKRQIDNVIAKCRLPIADFFIHLALQLPRIGRTEFIGIERDLQLAFGNRQSAISGFLC
jgi:hypothetical protein